MQFHKIEVDERVWNFLKTNAEPFVDTPNSVLNRILFGNGKSKQYVNKNEISSVNKPPLPHGTPKALSQILEVIYEIKNSGLTRNEATNIVAKRRGTAPQTVIDKYCRQLNKRAYEIDQLLDDRNLVEFKILLKTRFNRHKDLVESFFESLQDYNKNGGK